MPHESTLLELTTFQLPAQIFKHQNRPAQTRWLWENRTSAKVRPLPVTSWLVPQWALFPEHALSTSTRWRQWCWQRKMTESLYMRHSLLKINPQHKYIRQTFLSGETAVCGVTQRKRSCKKAAVEPHSFTDTDVSHGTDPQHSAWLILTVFIHPSNLHSFFWSDPRLPI